MRQVLKGDICYSKSPTELEMIPDGYLVCEDGFSKGVFPVLPEQYAGWPLTDYSDCMIIPGLVDLHVHAPQYAFRGMGMDLELLDWLNAHTFPGEARYSDPDYAEKAYSLFVKDLVEGPNTRAVVFATVHVPATLRLMEMLEQSGLVTLVGKVNMDRNSHPGLEEQSAEKSAADTIGWLESCAGRFENTGPILTPRFTPSCSDGLMRRLGEIRRKYSLPVQSHLSENQGEVAWVRKLCPHTSCYGGAYDQFGLFGGDVPTIMAHCVWSGGEETALMRRNGVFVAHCPQSNMNLSSGIAPVRDYLDNGINIGLGSDVAGGCHTSIFRAMSDAVQASKLYWRLVDQESKPLTVPEAFYLGTLGGGKFFGKVGSFEEGYELDAVVVDDSRIAGPSPIPLAGRLERIVYLSDDRDIKAKYARGRAIKVQ